MILLSNKGMANYIILIEEKFAIIPYHKISRKGHICIVWRPYICTQIEKMVKCSVQITLVDWNVRVNNLNIQNVVNSFVENDYDIITLQEVPHRCLASLQNIPGYNFVSCTDFDAPQDLHKILYLAVLTKHKIIKNDTIVIREQPVSTLFSKILYDRLRKIIPKYQALKTEIQIENTFLHINNVHLPCSVSPLTRLALLNELLEKVTKYEHSILTGDFNILSTPLLNLISGWLRDYTLAEYTVDERQEAEKLYAKHNMASNLFGISTSAFFPFSSMQMDNVLTPKSITVNSVSTLRAGGSDHRPVKVVLDI